MPTRPDTTSDVDGTLCSRLGSGRQSPVGFSKLEERIRQPLRDLLSEMSAFEREVLAEWVGIPMRSDSMTGRRIASMEHRFGRQLFENTKARIGGLLKACNVTYDEIQPIHIGELCVTPLP
jgi:hypothetical protein